MCVLFRALMLLVGAKSSSELGCSRANTRAPRRRRGASGTPEERSIRLEQASVGNRGVLDLEPARANKQKETQQLWLRSTSRRGDDGRVCVPNRIGSAASGNLSSSTPPPHSLNAASESGLTQTCSYARARAEGRPRVVSATCWSTATSLPAAYASQARRTQA